MIPRSPVLTVGTQARLIAVIRHERNPLAPIAEPKALRRRFHQARQLALPNPLHGVGGAHAVTGSMWR